MAIPQLFPATSQSTSHKWIERQAFWTHKNLYSSSRSFTKTCARIWAIVFPILLKLTYFFKPHAVEFQTILDHMNRNFSQDLNICFRDGGCDHFLSEPIFKPYVAHIRSLLDTYRNLHTDISHLSSSILKVKLLELYQHLQKDHSDFTITNNRMYYGAFIDLLRDIQTELQNYPQKNEKSFQSVLTFLHEFIQSYMQVDLFYKPGMEFLYSKGLSRTLTIQDMSEIPQALQTAFSQLKHNKHCGMVEGLFDPFHLGNLPFKVYNLHTQNKQTTVFRCSNVVMDKARQGNILTQTAIGEQFLLFLDAHHAQRKRHLYINLMKRDPQEREGIRSSTIETLEESYPETIQVASLDRNSDFYWHAGLSDEGTTFKGQFFAHLQNRRFFYWPKELFKDHSSESSWQNTMHSIIEEVHATYFQSKTSLTLDERRAFIELTYCMIIDSLIQKLNPDTSNFSCKNCVDRGGITNSLMYLYFLKKQGSPVGQKEFNYLLYLLFLPALLVGNRPIQECYFNRFILCAKLFINPPTSDQTPLPISKEKSPLEISI